MEIIYEDEEILVCVKEAGIATESASVRDRDLFSLVKAHVNGRYIGMVHRLDRPVSGLLVFAKTPDAAASLSQQVQDEEMGKDYLAIVEGKLEETPEPVILTDYLIRNTRESCAEVVTEHAKDANGKRAKRAQLSYEVLFYDAEEDLTTLRIHLLTGRFHQIRAQLSHLGHPVKGDTRYGAKKPADPKGSAGISLCAYQLRFLHPKTKEKMVFQLPPDVLQ